LKIKVKYFLFHFLFWYLYFVAARLLFLIFQHKLCRGIDIKDIFLTFFHGARLDFSITAYILTFSLLLLILSSIVNNKLILLINKIYNLILLILIGFIIVSDIELYTYWGFRIDTTPLFYINEKEAFTASLAFWQLIASIFIVIIWCTISIKLYLRIFRSYSTHFKLNKISFAFILAFPLLFIVVRGGVQIAPLNTGSAYFHSNQFLNHVALNPIWNALYSLTEVKNINESYTFLNKKQAEEIIKKINETQGQSIQLLNCDKPNIILIMLESFTAKVIEPLGGVKGITPNLNNLIKEGILFNHFYATGDRTEKGLVSVLGAYPPLPKTQIIKFPSKSEKLDYIPKVLKEYSYSTVFFYGGSIEFANYNSILVSAGFDTIISLKNIDKSHPRTKWGVQDHIMFKYLLDFIPDSNTSFFYTMLTLSSHEPFAIPGVPHVEGNAPDIKFLNSVYYTDECIGNFIAQAKKSAWWHNTLIVFVADHGSHMPGYSSIQDPVKYHIPMIWAGGALNVRDTIISTYGSQTDIARTLLNQLSIEHSGFPFSRDLTATYTYPFAFFTYNNGFGILTPHSELVYDHNAGKYMTIKGRVSEFDFNAGKAYLQVVNEDFINK
jgi:phosphoglycerol transferase MdoB-like AlkP superfamily enzyme